MRKGTSATHAIKNRSIVGKQRTRSRPEINAGPYVMRFCNKTGFIILNKGTQSLLIT